MTEHTPDEENVDPLHDPTGLDLASAMARSTKGGKRKPPKKTPRRDGVHFSGAHPDDRDPKPLGQLVKNLTREAGWGTRMGIHLLLTRWAEIVGPTVAEHSRPETFEDGVVTVRTSSTAWASQVRLMAPRIVAKLNEAVGQGKVTRILVLGPQAPTWKHGVRAVRDGRGPRDTYG